MQRRYNPTHFLLASVVVLSLTLLMVCVDAQAQIAFTSERDGNKEIYVINADGRRDPRRLTKNRHDDTDPAWFNPAFAFAVTPVAKKFSMWGWLKQIKR